MSNVRDVAAQSVNREYLVQIYCVQTRFGETFRCKPGVLASVKLTTERINTYYSQYECAEKFYWSMHNTKI